MNYLKFLNSLESYNFYRYTDGNCELSVSLRSEYLRFIGKTLEECLDQVIKYAELYV